MTLLGQWVPLYNCKHMPKFVFFILLNNFCLLMRNELKFVIVTEEKIFFRLLMEEKI